MQNTKESVQVEESEDLSHLPDDIEKRYHTWLINKNLLDSESLEDSIFIEKFVRNDVALNEEDRKPDQRLLLDVEKKGEIIRAKERMKSEFHENHARRVVSAKVKELVEERIQDKDHITRNLLRLPSAFFDIINMIHGPSVNFRDIAMTIERNVYLVKPIIELVNEPNFCNALGVKPKGITEIRPALGFLGITGIRIVVPILMLRDRIRYNCEYFPMLGSKIWASAVTMGNTVRAFLLNAGEDRDDQEELQGLSMGMLPFLGYIAVHHQFLLSFDDAKQQLLGEFRENLDEANRPLYNAIIEVEPDPSLLVQLFSGHARKISCLLLDDMVWDRLPRAQQGILEWAESVPIEERSKHGLAMQQALRFSRFELLRRAKRFPKKSHIRPYLQPMMISQDLAKDLIVEDLRRVNLRQYINVLC